MGWWAPTLGITWAELYDPETNIEAGCTILKKCLDKQHSGKKVQRIRGALACYNGSEAYANAVLDRLGEMMIERML